jgi:hypothetical protein
MDWVLLACCAVMAWVGLAVIAGERERREQERRVQRLAREADQAAASGTGG